MIGDPLTTMTAPLGGYRRMAWVVGALHGGHWESVPHYGHIEVPKQLAAMLVDAVRWVSQKFNGR